MQAEADPLSFRIPFLSCSPQGAAIRNLEDLPNTAALQTDNLAKSRSREMA